MNFLTSGRLHLPLVVLSGMLYLPLVILSSMLHLPLVVLSGRLYLPRVILSGMLHLPLVVLSSRLYLPLVILSGMLHLAVGQVVLSRIKRQVAFSGRSVVLNRFKRQVGWQVGCIKRHSLFAISFALLCTFTYICIKFLQSVHTVHNLLLRQSAASPSPLLKPISIFQFLLSSSILNTLDIKNCIQLLVITLFPIQRYVAFCILAFHRHAERQTLYTTRLSGNTFPQNRHYFKSYVPSKLTLL